MNLITLTTDFGLEDPFVGMMKGVIYGINRSVRIIDITHGIENQDVIEGAFVIGHSRTFFPKDTIHVVVVDPGVGSARRPLLVSAYGQYFIGPDNGVLSLAVVGDMSARAIEITADHYFLKNAGATFHGRDIFAPVAAWLSRGIEPHYFGNLTTEYTRLNTPKTEKGAAHIKGSVIYIDKFGNIITNIPQVDLNPMMQKGAVTTRLCGTAITGIRTYYAEAEAGELGAVINSFGLLEIYAYMGNAAAILHSRKGDPVETRLQQ